MLLVNVVLGDKYSTFAEYDYVVNGNYSKAEMFCDYIKRRFEKTFGSELHVEAKIKTCLEPDDDFEKSYETLFGCK